MERAFADYLNRLQNLHAEIDKAIGGLPVKALDWAPTADMNSLAVLVVHLAGAERYWIGDVIAQDPSGRNREAEFRTQGLTVEQLKQRLNDADAFARTVLESLKLADLEAERLSTRDNRQYSVAYALSHVLAHTALHVGHAQIMRQLWDTRQS